MARAQIKLNHAEIGRILREDMRKPIDELADAVAEKVDLSVTTVDAEVRVRSYVSPYKGGRAAASVSIAHPAGLNVEAKHGVLHRAAAELGLEVKDRAEK